MVARGPTLLLVEDAHWIDPTTLDFLTTLIARTDLRGLMIVCTHRPEFSPPWPEPQVTPLSLSRLSRQGERAIIEHLAGAEGLSQEVIETLLLNADGVPLFVEELTKAVVNDEPGPPPAGAAGPIARSVIVPGSLRESLIARLDRLATAWPVVRVAASIGRSFSYRLLATVIETANGFDVDAALSQMFAAGVLQARGRGSNAAYSFSHALLQEAAYDSLLKSQRVVYHAQIAETLERSFPELVAAQPEFVAQHFSAADKPELATRYWLQAGQRAAASSANLEAVAHLRAGLAELPRFTGAADREEQEYGSSHPARRGAARGQGLGGGGGRAELSARPRAGARPAAPAPALRRAARAVQRVSDSGRARQSGDGQRRAAADRGGDRGHGAADGIPPLRRRPLHLFGRLRGRARLRCSAAQTCSIATATAAMR